VGRELKGTSDVIKKGGEGGGTTGDSAPQVFEFFQNPNPTQSIQYLTKDTTPRCAWLPTNQESGVVVVVVKWKDDEAAESGHSAMNAAQAGQQS